ncbi:MULTISPECIES: hypothetical protein [unclassified Halomonas]|uniref:hypothetical protein n=1 Tax=unclassified Halomonas TaxID=2609666 RepID=UPI002076BD0C|nr:MULTISPECIES: hypothetical protein [unclassified Halomonas]
MRDIYRDPRVGDRVQIIPRICNRLPEPLTITQVTERAVYWQRPLSGQKSHLALALWKRPTSFRLELLEAAQESSADQADMFGGAA